MTGADLEHELASLKERLSVAEETLSALYKQEVDALIIAGPDGDQVFTLQGAETPYRLLVEAMSEGTLTLTADGTVLYCNQRFAEMTGLPLEQVIGSAWFRFFPPEEQAKAKALLAPSRNGGTKDEFTLRTAGGPPLPVQLSLRQLDLDGVSGFVVLVTEITELKRLHQALCLANEQLESRVVERTHELAAANQELRLEIAERRQAELALAEAQAKLHRHAEELEQRVRERTARLRETVEDLEAFSYSVSHDLRAPMRSIQSFSQVLASECADRLSPVELDYLNRIITSAARMDELTLDLLAYSRTTRDSLELEPVSLDRVVRETIEATPAVQQSAAQITIEGTLPTVLGHRPTLVQCISNLLANAVKFVPPNTTPRVNIRAEFLDQTARIWIEDNGIGIDPNDHERIFRIFERINNSKEYPGTGIGLSIVKRVIERMGGSVGVESDLGRGSKFWVQLPLAGGS